MSRSLLRLEQYRTTCLNLENDVEKNTTILNDLGFSLSTLDTELKKLYSDIQSKSKQIDLENKKIESLKKRQDASQIICLIYCIRFYLIFIIIFSLNFRSVIW